MAFFLFDPFNFDIYTRVHCYNFQYSLILVKNTFLTHTNKNLIFLCSKRVCANCTITVRLILAGFKYIFLFYCLTHFSQLSSFGMVLKISIYTLGGAHFNFIIVCLFIWPCLLSNYESDFGI